jgi:hypothetical protein
VREPSGRSSKNANRLVQRAFRLGGGVGKQVRLVRIGFLGDAVDAAFGGGFDGRFVPV